MKFIAQADLPAWLAELASSMRVVAPRIEGNTVVYRDYDAEKGIELTRKPTESAKHVLFPRSEELFSFAYKRPAFGIPEKGQAVDDTSEVMKLEVSTPADPAPTVIFGMTGCDAGSVTTFDPIYSGSKFKDVYYLKKRDATILIVRACNEVLSTCFCTWVGGDPANRQNGDILATEVSGGLLLEPLTDRAEKIMSSTLLKDAEKGLEKTAAEQHKAARESIGEVPKLKGVDNALFKLFDNAEFWQAESASCLACGACTYLCPTCHCFSITDETAGKSGVRLRSWDTCMASLYTMEASGHNPRMQKAARLKNRVGHKFAYFIRNNDGQISCCGCGRCIRSCPSSVDIRQIVKDALASAGKAKEKADG
ncbi:4Fe-4S dicluster domain-containing protein [Desulfovibrio sp. OttesenSCG-928-O18]|nr:4Fe-4S dicluster domain-containing protein [Desulfovibrio sp. OttesenSCG-928-O18]MDL2209760.1 4Fe-4S dicluster domain-containing protein [Desulfovibrio sp. OttesenSCG-928-O18]